MEKKMESTIMGSMGGCQNYDPFLGTLNVRCRIIIGILKGAIILTTSHVLCVIMMHCNSGPPTSVF